MVFAFAVFFPATGRFKLSARTVADAIRSSLNVLRDGIIVLSYGGIFFINVSAGKTITPHEGGFTQVTGAENAALHV